MDCSYHILTDKNSIMLARGEDFVYVVGLGEMRKEEDALYFFRNWQDYADKIVFAYLYKTKYPTMLIKYFEGIENTDLQGAYNHSVQVRQVQDLVTSALEVEYSDFQAISDAYTKNRFLVGNTYLVKNKLDGLSMFLGVVPKGKRKPVGGIRVDNFYKDKANKIAPICIFFHRINNQDMFKVVMDFADACDVLESDIPKYIMSTEKEQFKLTPENIRKLPNALQAWGLFPKGYYKLAFVGASIALATPKKTPKFSDMQSFVKAFASLKEEDLNFYELPTITSVTLGKAKAEFESNMQYHLENAKKL